MELAQKYEVRLKVFEGPLDLLVYLVQKNELEPREIPISIITDQYLQYIEEIGIDNLSHAGDFLVMASRLMRLKAQELLPDEEKDEIEDLELDLDKEALIQQMIEYQKFKEASKFLRHHETRNFGTYPRGLRDKPPKEKTSDEDFAIESDIYGLMMAFATATKSKKRVPIHDIEIDDVTIENQIKKIQQFLTLRPKCQFEDLFEDDPRRIVIVVSFMAILELGKLSQIFSRQHQTQGPIYIYKNSGAADGDFDFGSLDVGQKEKEEFKPGLVDFIQNELHNFAKESELDKVLRELGEELEEELNPTKKEEKQSQLISPLSLLMDEPELLSQSSIVPANEELAVSPLKLLLDSGSEEIKNSQENLPEG